jgi:hypothetical protein
VNVVGNVFVKGPNSSVEAFTRGNANFKAFVEGNVYDADKNGNLNSNVLPATSASYGGVAIQATKFAYPAPAKILSAAEALALAEKSVGASKVRDAVDRRLVDELKSYGKLGQLISDENASPMNGPGTIEGGTAWVDANGNGIPDDMEAKFKTVEDWANSLVSSAY